MLGEQAEHRPQLFDRRFGVDHRVQDASVLKAVLSGRRGGVHGLLVAVEAGEHGRVGAAVAPQMPDLPWARRRLPLRPTALPTNGNPTTASS